MMPDQPVLIRELQLRRRRSRVPWVYAVYHRPSKTPGEENRRAMTTPGHPRFLAVVTCLVFAVGCARPAVSVDYRNTFSRAERRAIEAIAEQAAVDVRILLPTLPAELELTVQHGDKVIPETGETGEVGLPAHVYWTVNPQHAGGVIAIVNAQLRATLFHEFYHLVRANSGQGSSLNLTVRAINEGLATAFERDHGGAPTPWGAYPDDVSTWAKEFLALRGDALGQHWMSRHPDGRRWIGYKVGTWLADRAVKESGLSLEQLASVPAARILEWARPD